MERWLKGPKKTTITNSTQLDNFSVSRHSNNNTLSYIDEFDAFAFKEIVFNLVIKKKRNETKLAWRYCTPVLCCVEWRDKSEK